MNEKTTQSHPHHVASPIRKFAYGAGMAAGSLILAPTLLPAIGLGTYDRVAQITTVMHGTGYGDGLAGAINSAIGQLPGIGETLLEGGLPAAAIIGGIGIGGWLLSKFFSHSGKDWQVKLGKAIRYTSLATSALMALPSALTAMGIGLTYLANTLISPEFSTKVMDGWFATLGTVGDANIATSGLSGVAATLPHLLTCGAPLIPLGIVAMESDESGAPRSHRTPAIALQILTYDPMRAGETVPATAILIDTKTGRRLSEEDLAVMHTEKLHMFVVDETLQDYHHIHPKPTSEPGVFAFDFIPKTNHHYHCFADITTAHDQKQHTAHCSLEGTMPPRFKPAITTSMFAETAQLHARWVQPESPLQQGRASEVTIELKDKSGRVVDDLEPVMGAYAHLVGFNGEQKGLVHAHPLGVEPDSPQSRGLGLLKFHLTPEISGRTQFYVQVKHHGKEEFLPFGQYIAPASKAVERLQQQSVHAHHGLAMG